MELTREELIRDAIDVSFINIFNDLTYEDVQFIKRQAYELIDFFAESGIFQEDGFKDISDEEIIDMIEEKRDERYGH